MEPIVLQTMSEKASEFGFKLPLGWRKALIPQRIQTTKGQPITQANFVYFSPNGLKFHSLDEVKNFINNKSTELKPPPKKKRKLDQTQTANHGGPSDENGVQTERSMIYSCQINSYRATFKGSKSFSKSKNRTQSKIKR